MGTSKGYMPPSNGDWTPLKSDITNLANIIDLDKPDKKQKLLSKIIGEFVTAIGGASDFSKAAKASKKDGKTIFASKVGRSTALAVGGFFASVANDGLQRALQKKGISFTNLTIEDLKEKIVEYFLNSSNSDDANAANKAISEVINELFNSIDSPEQLENRITSVIETESILCDFFGKYIFKRFERSFYEIDIKKYGLEKAIKIMQDVENAIIIKLKTYQCKYKLSDLSDDITKSELLIQGILGDVMGYLEDGND